MNHDAIAVQFCLGAGLTESQTETLLDRLKGAPPDQFRGDNVALVSSIQALLALDEAGALVPHGVGGHARGLLTAAAARLVAQPTIGAIADEEEQAKRFFLNFMVPMGAASDWICYWQGWQDRSQFQGAFTQPTGKGANHG